MDRELEKVVFDIGRIELVKQIRRMTLLEYKPVKDACAALIPFFSGAAVTLTVGRLFDICSIAHQITDGSVMVQEKEIFRKAEDGEIVRPGVEYYIKTEFSELEKE